MEDTFEDKAVGYSREAANGDDRDDSDCGVDVRNAFDTFVLFTIACIK